MSKLLSLLLLTLALFLAAPLAAQDRLTTTGGDVLVGKFERLEGGKIVFKTDKIGEVKVAVADVRSLEFAAERKARIRTTDKIEEQREVTLVTREGKVYVRESNSERAAALDELKGIDETMPDNRPKWTIGARAFMSWTEGNTDTLAMGFRVDIKRERKTNELSLYGEGNYLEDRDLEEDIVRRRDYAVGARYRYIFSFNLTVDVTQDFLFNEFAGYHYKSITGVGPSYYFIRSDDLTINVGAHGLYVYEDQILGAEDRGYFGARAFGEIDAWFLTRDLHVNFKTEVLFDFDEFKNLVWNNQLIVEYRFLNYFSFGLLLKHTFDNLPPPKVLHNDFYLGLTLGVQWGGPGF